MSDMSWPSQFIFKTNPPLSPGWIKALWSHCEPLLDTPALSQVLLPFWLPSTHKVCLQHMCHIPWSVHIWLQKTMQRDWSGKNNVLFSSGLRSHVSTHKWLNPNKRKAQANCQQIRKCTERLKTASEPDKCSPLRSTGLGSFPFWGQNSLFQVLRREYKQWLSTAADHPGQELNQINQYNQIMFGQCMDCVDCLIVSTLISTCLLDTDTAEALAAGRWAILTNRPLANATPAVHRLEWSQAITGPVASDCKYQALHKTIMSPKADLTPKLKKSQSSFLNNLPLFLKFLTRACPRDTSCNAAQDLASSPTTRCNPFSREYRPMQNTPWPLERFGQRLIYRIYSLMCSMWIVCFATVFELLDRQSQ